MPWRMNPVLTWFVLSTANTKAEVGVKVDLQHWFDECDAVFKEELYGLGKYELSKRSNYALADTEHGLCSDFLLCAWKQCTITEKSFPRAKPEQYTDFWKTNPPNNLPDRVMHPAGVKEVLLGMHEADKAKQIISVKLSGHSYVGSSTEAGSLMLNLRKLPAYAGTSIRECVPDYLKHKALCTFAAARGKKAFIRVGGGEFWDDVYKAVHVFNEGHETKYHVVGGGVGSLGAVGGWLQGGGLSATTGMRAFGLGVDQVLRIEMVLAIGRHVRITPVEWAAVADGDLYPKVKKVKGECNTKAWHTNDESRWKWSSCEGIDFDDLWFAVRGGGGGTYGIVTSVYLQLHEHHKVTMVITQAPVLKSITEESKAVFRKVWIDFFIQYFFPEDHKVDSPSNFCGSDTFPLDPFRAGGRIFCLDDEFQNMKEAWKAHLKAHLKNSKVADHYDGDLDSLADGMLRVAYQDKLGYYEMLLEDKKHNPSPRVPEGRIPDEPPPRFSPDTSETVWTAMLPRKWLRSDRGTKWLTDWVIKNGNFPNGRDDWVTYVLGGNVKRSDDGMNAIPQAERDCGFLIYVQEGEDADSLMASMADSLIAGKTFNGNAEYNHIGAQEFGPLKSDLSKHCPKEWSLQEKLQKCVSIQEKVWGTTMLKRLEGIKKKVDPESRFQCWACVGYDFSKMLSGSSGSSDTAIDSAIWVWIVVVPLLVVSAGGIFVLYKSGWLGTLEKVTKVNAQPGGREIVTRTSGGDVELSTMTSDKPLNKW